MRRSVAAAGIQEASGARNASRLPSGTLRADRHAHRIRDRTGPRTFWALKTIRTSALIMLNRTVRNGVFTDGRDIRGSFYGPSHEEVGGVFDRNLITGAFGAKRAP